MVLDLMGAVLTVMGPGAGGFLGSWGAFYFYCPNRRCCQMSKVHALLEKGDTRK